MDEKAGENKEELHKLLDEVKELIDNICRVDLFQNKNILKTSTA